ncbi:MAG: hypothetical protein C0514_09060, partial [Candidatus Puniceispirillum sp.]|nr:hypothetical protein [Candidatus Puniceispirillum sp.]
LGRPALAGEAALARGADGASDPVGHMIRTREAARIASENARHTPTPRTQPASSSSGAAESLERADQAAWLSKRAPFSAEKPNHMLTTEDFLVEVATRAERKIGGTGPVAGSKKHAYAKRLTERHDRLYGPIHG